MKAWGLEGNFVPAEATGRGGNTGGQFVAAARSLGVSTLAAFSLEGNGWCGVVLEMTGSKMAVFSIYLKTGEGILGQTNVQILGALRGCIKQLADGLPWMVVGDWNSDPAVVGESTFLRSLSGIVLDTGEATFATTASNLDFVVAHRSLAGLMTV